jgi:hypothetical protein
VCVTFVPQRGVHPLNGQKHHDAYKRQVERLTRKHGVAVKPQQLGVTIDRRYLKRCGEPACGWLFWAPHGNNNFCEEHFSRSARWAAHNRRSIRSSVTTPWVYSHNADRSILYGSDLQDSFDASRPAGRRLYRH